MIKYLNVFLSIELPLQSALKCSAFFFVTPISPFKQTHACTHLCRHSSPPPPSPPKALRHCERGCLPSSPRFMASACLSDNIWLSEISSHEGAVKLVTSACRVLLSSHNLPLYKLECIGSLIAQSSLSFLCTVHPTQQPYCVTTAQGTIFAITVT